MEDADPKALKGGARSDKKGGVNDVLAVLAGGPMPKSDLLSALAIRLSCGDKTARRRVREAEPLISISPDGMCSIASDS